MYTVDPMFKEIAKPNMRSANSSVGLHVLSCLSAIRRIRKGIIEKPTIKG
jgi:hypothetical protein